MANDSKFVLAHLSDPHLTDLGGIAWRELINKRALGYWSWRKRRRYAHRPEILAALVADLRRRKPDHVAVTGDLTQLGTEDECRQALAWLDALGPPDQVTLVPGNHDALVAAPWDKTLARWTPYMTSDAYQGTDRGSDPSDLFPSLRIRGEVALIGLNSARPSAPLLAVGSVGKRQLADLERMLREMCERNLCRVILIHHPPVPGSIAWRKRLTDARRLQAVIAREGVELVLHGHGHRTSASGFGTPRGRAPVLGAPSASAQGEHGADRAQYRICTLHRQRDGWRLSLSVREYLPQRKGFEEITEREYLL